MTQMAQMARKLLVTVNPATAMKGLIDQPPAAHYPPLKPSDIHGFAEPSERAARIRARAWLLNS